MNVIEGALAQGRSALTEFEAKRFLTGFGIPVCRENLALDSDAAAAEAASIGFPVVLKASGAGLLHKTEVGGVALNLKTEPEVLEEGRRLLNIPGCDGLLVQEMVRGDRELVCGLTRDAQLGPCVMFGLGGIFTETLDDAVFRLAPLTSLDAQEMLEEIRSAKILGPFRGQPAVDKAGLSSILIALGTIGPQYDAIREIDLNPVKIRPDGSPVVVDALISLAPMAAARL
ncbi:MAG TPA: acetate--CoA ligase family protein [Candidatus Methylomirabilis sp.]|nr:acetate--CoA ligase family protein [Candidatus Methylomirabilis sp.]HSC72044.1 acetate--CoA ligase family protein [Candidatus Methylomirabilis sp.]